MKLGIACSTGGHLLQLLQLERVYSKYNHFFLTFKRPMSKSLSNQEKVFFVKDPGKNPINLLINVLQSLSIFIQQQPDVVISTGAGVAVPICYIAKFFGKKVIFIESFSRIHHPSLSGTFVYPIADLFIVQWKQLLKFYKGAKYGGSIF
jgi:UDP-N-acetylglucosamine:LPS N-acetylglucosamine transferase